MSKQHIKNNQPFFLRRCYFCGTHVQIKHADEYISRIHKNGRSFVFCIEHLKKLRSVASPALIDDYRRRSLKEENKVLCIRLVKFETMMDDLIYMRQFFNDNSPTYANMR